MAEHSGFFNALLVDEVYDRKYDADDYSDNLAVVISNGVLRSTDDDLKVTASGLVPTVAIGRAWINGHWYYNDTAMSLTAIQPPTSGNRYDRILLRFNNALLSRSIQVVYLQGTAASTPTKPAYTRYGDIYDLVLADIYIQANASTMTVTDTRSDSTLCGWVYSTSGDDSFFTSLDGQFNTWFQEKKDTLASVTLFKRYNWRTVLAAASTTVTFSIPQYDADTCFLEVFVNGILETATTDYTLSGSTLTFTGTLTAGTEVEVKVYKSIDGTGIQSVSEEITELQNQYATLAGVSNFTYKCTGSNDNISLSQIAQAFLAKSYTASEVTTAANTFLTALGGNTYLAALPDDAQITVNVVGRLGATTPHGGAGTAASRYRWFSLGKAATSDMRIIFDFAKTEKINIAMTASTDNIIFYGTDLYIKNANVYASCSGVSCPVEMLAGSANTGKIEAENCRFIANTSGLAVISEHGSFTNCFCKVISTASNAYVFNLTSESLVKIIGGTFYAYRNGSNYRSAIITLANTATNGVLIGHNLNCPTVTLTGYTQDNFIVSSAGKALIYGVVSLLASSGSYHTINGLCEYSKP